MWSPSPCYIFKMRTIAIAKEANSISAYVLLDHLKFGFCMQVRVCSGKPVTIVASRAGFYLSRKRTLINHSLVGLLQQTSRAFDGVRNF
jgi:hypothetical protein